MSNLSTKAGADPFSRLPALLPDGYATHEVTMMIRHSPAALADAFCTTRLDDDGGGAYGCLPAGIDQRAIVDRARMTVPEEAADA